MGIPAAPINPGHTVSGKISWFGGPSDPSAGGTPASGIPISTPGIATYNRATLGGYFLVTAPNGRRAVLRQTDLGPAPWTGRAIDFTYSSLPLLGYSQGNFPTDAVAHATYLGKTVPGQYRSLLKGGGPAPKGAVGTPQTTPAPPTFKAITTQGFDQAGFHAAQKAAFAGRYLASSGSKDPYSVGAPKTGLEGSASLAGILPTMAPNPSDYQTAQTQLQKIAGAPVAMHPTGQVALANKAITDAKNAGAGPAAQKLLRMLKFVSGAGYSQGNHDDINQNEFSVKAKGTDCSGLISWLMGPQGLGIWSSSLATPAIPNAPGLQAGQGKVVTIYNNRQPGNAGHVFIRVGNQYFASEGGVGVHQLPLSEVQGYLTHGSDGGTYQAYHPKGL